MVLCLSCDCGVSPPSSSYWLSGSVNHLLLQWVMRCPAPLRGSAPLQLDSEWRSTEGWKHSIDLDERSNGDISCSVKNHVSHAQNTTRLKPCPGLDRFCSFDQSDPCYTALGDKLYLLMLDTSKYDLKMQKRINNPQDDPVCRVRDDEMKRNQCDLYSNRPEVTVIKGTLIINSVIRTDSGNYRLTVYNSDGSETSRDLQVIVQVSSSVFVLVWCLQLMVLLGLLGAFHIYMRHTSGKKQEDQKIRMRRFREGHEHAAEDS
ncbi:uncharacterized protein LOC122335349 [Puntigrus tetrazona]|uniref:uncharacterized protein LOC122335349 n=1 Tax=Puntigrus tetrazona TaxID=1606681 RepID=UPI001C894685|nr:uncharacterized protein LOC122335349 [Puntigrus tetrazona]